jgi:hypothetical protein
MCYACLWLSVANFGNGREVAANHSDHQLLQITTTDKPPPRRLPQTSPSSEIPQILLSRPPISSLCLHKPSSHNLPYAQSNPRAYNPLSRRSSSQGSPLCRQHTASAHRSTCLTCAPPWRSRRPTGSWRSGEDGPLVRVVGTKRHRHSRGGGRFSGRRRRLL